MEDLNITPEQAIEILKGNENYVVRTKDDDSAFVQSQINTAIGTRYQQIDEDIFSLTGIEKQRSEDGTPEKTYNYVKNSIKKEQEKAISYKEELKKVKGELESLKLSGGSQEEFDKKAQELVKEKNELIEAYEQKLIAQKQESESFVNKLQVKNSIDTFRPQLDTELKGLDYVLQGVEIEMLSLESRVNESGQTVYYNDGKPMLSNNDGHFLTAGEIIADKLSPYMKTIPQQTGTGGTGENQQSQNVKPFSTREDVDTYLRQEGYNTGSSEWLAKRKELIQGNKL